MTKKEYEEIPFGTKALAGFFGSAGLLALAIALIIAFLLTGCKNPGGTDPIPTTPVRLDTNNIVVGINAEIWLYASGGDGQNYSWTVSGGGTVTPLVPSSRARLNTGAIPGTFQITVVSGGSQDSGTFRVLSTNWLELVKVSPSSGSTVGRKTGIRMTVRYVTNQQGLEAMVDAFAGNKELIPSLSTTVVHFGASGEAEITGRFGEMDTDKYPATVKYLRFQMLRSTDFKLVAEFWIDYTLILV